MRKSAKKKENAFESKMLSFSFQEAEVKIRTIINIKYTININKQRKR